MEQETGWSPDDEHDFVTDEQDYREPNGEHVSTLDVIRALIQDGREYASLEVEKQKLRAGIFATGARKAAVLGGAALFLLFGLLVAIPIGAIWILSPHVGPLAATAIVLVVGLLIVLVLAQLAKAKFRATMRKINIRDEMS